MDEVSFIAMKCWIFKFALFLILGAIVNVLVAWACTLGLNLSRLSGPSERSSTTAESEPYWVVDQLQRPGAMRYVWVYIPFDFGPAPGLDFYILSRPEPVDLKEIPQWSQLAYSKSPPKRYHLWAAIFIDDARGWPFLSMSSFSAMGAHPMKNEILVKSIGGFPVPESLRFQPQFKDIEVEWFNCPIVPFRPIWSGFAINTTFYAAMLWGLTFGPFAARRYIRNKRGLCIKCGYDLRGTEHEVCPECGWKCVVESIQ